ncbi:hypothetical protein JOE63_002777 [Cellulosimicrobium cellulans]|uniref:hypothetical protein n=1 Tax=Cellulosimicrobium cellulans TaxID=1710 RepID=UPI001EF785F2|nr:hypothetical protein [Cellulosimicrobium cellulans]MBM7820300.1 hypothetical protein [Cellulosimicrobium cellulans]
MSAPAAPDGADPTATPAPRGTAPRPSTSRRTNTGFGRVLVAVYGIFALAASARAGVQLLRDWHEAPLAYALSALAAAVYVVATIALARGGEVARRVAWVAVGVELVGVLAVGAFSLADPEAFPRATVWSGFGQGYGYVPLVLPFVGLWWLWHTRPGGASPAAAPSTTSTRPDAPEDAA